MSLFVVESYDWQIFHSGAYSDGVVGEGAGSEKLYLHVIALNAGQLAKLTARKDEHGNTQSERLTLPRNEEWWIALAGTKAWPKIARPRITSHCKDDQHGVPRPQPLSAEAIAQLRAKGVDLSALAAASE